jgi:hypothetical protein
MWLRFGGAVVQLLVCSHDTWIENRDSIGSVEVSGAKASEVALPHRLVGYAVEQDGGRNRLHVQVDVPAKGFQQSALRVAGATVELVVTRPEPQKASTEK